MEISIYNWKCEQVIEWLKGLECISNSYIKAFANNQIDGRQLLGVRPYELEELGIVSVGHQEIILEAVEQLRNFHYNLDKENLQFLSMQVSTLSTSLHKQLSYDPESKNITAQILSDVTRTVSKVKTLISWLDRHPFQGHTQYSEIRVQMLRLGLELATVAQRDRFSQNPIKQIINLAEKLSKLSDYIIQDITDPMLLQPAYLDLVTLKKRESEFGFYIMPSTQFINRITDIKYNSPAHNSGKIDDGDEIVQINYQTVVGWQYKKVLMQLEESATDVLLTLKKRPKHTKIYGQLGLIKLPSKKRSIPYRWDNLPSPRVEFFNMPDLLMPTAKIAKKDSVISDTEESSGNESDAMTPMENKSSEMEHRLYMPKPRAAVLQRRHTIAGDDLTNFQSIGSMVLWHNRKINRENLDSPSLRDKSVSFGFGLDSQRPTTCLGITDNRLKTSLPAIAKKNGVIEEVEEKQETVISTGVSKVVRFDPNKSLDYNPDSKYVCMINKDIIESLMPIPFADEENAMEVEEEDSTMLDTVRNEPPKPAPRTFFETKTSEAIVEAVNAIVVNREIVKRGRLDKSHSTPAYTDDTDIPPAIEPRQQTVKIPPVPPRKNTLAPPAIETNDENKSKIANVIDLKPMKRTPSTSSLTRSIQEPSTVLEKAEKSKRRPYSLEISEETELVTPAKVKTLKKREKNLLMAKRRKISLKSLGTSSTIQGHLYRRAKDKTEVAYWAKLYFVLCETALYGFKNKDAIKADCVIYLSGFTVSLAKEVHSKQFAFKVYHPKKTFYLAAETSEALAQWMEYIRQATMKGSTNLDCESKELYSETECSEDEFDLISKQLCTPSPMKPLEKLNADHTPSSKHHYHLNFGSLKKFKLGNPSPSGENSSPSDHRFLGFFSSNKSAEKKSADIMRTAQFKTYKKVKESNGGLQLGATSMINSTVSDMYLHSGADNSSILSGFTIDTRKKLPENLPVPDEIAVKKPEKLVKHTKKSLNYLHASNPNLLDFNFPSTVDFPASSNSTCNSTWEPQNGMTLLDLMTQQLDEEKKDMYNKRVEQGIEKIDQSTLQKKLEKPAIPPKPADPHIEKIQKRSLPITPDYAQSFKPDDKELKFTRTKEGQKLRDFGYELINGEDTTNLQVESAKVNEKLFTKKGTDKVGPTGSLKKKSGFNWMLSHSEKPEEATISSSGSFRKTKSTLKTNNDKFLSKPANLLNAPLPFDKNFQLISTSKVLRKNSAPNSSSNSIGIPYFSKLSFSSSSCKEKKLLGSPKLHRAIFGRGNQSPASSIDHEIFSPITFPKRSADNSRRLPSETSSDVGVTSFPNYPELQTSLPPVFKPEIYSLNMMKKPQPKND